MSKGSISVVATSAFDGVVNVSKPAGWTSHDVVEKLRQSLGIRKVGHGGTLDPLAEGILPIAIGKATKLIPFINKDFKEYEFEVKWGEQSWEEMFMGFYSWKNIDQGGED